MEKGDRLMRLILVVLGVGLFPHLIYAAISLTGQYENRFSLLDYQAGLVLVDENQFRLNLEALSDQRTRLEAAAWAQTFHGRTNLPISCFVPAWVADSISDSLKSLFDVRLADRFVLDRAYVSVRRACLSIKAGKQPLAWGVGYLWNPTEIIPAKSLLDPGYEREGMNALRLGISSLGHSLQLFFLPGSDFARSEYVGLLAGNLLGYDWAVIGMRHFRTSMLKEKE
ncbi:hypothetical protein CH330_08815 [candidate division WOR-3 bacterium JGI_Cruoil_03_51_56]|uniref:Uncharacterized protein n=1 Tax=candidate division WOR-3 bacterium JGI_Cruoil_03_51_56 TaxID=1973747 RepID=A0A235BNQ1_UNCW3|nr:MAG: hypothetical protein CH330_10055 [candidate division WOR-3 bacterium JGI_Cruoil_03_51_56]OYD14373.1 MAG: hypothetical protein CH330_08815 [candidate division WOR-3 bacterium JGI_Cruoil_03_51_56]